MVMVAARLVEAFCYVFGATIRAVVFTVLDGCDWMARWFR